MQRRHLAVVLVLLLAFALRTYHLTAIPPGLTHDEANHGREAMEILDGVLRYFFPLNYGSEPLYSYTVAGVMAALGEHLLALRLVNVMFGLLAIAAAWTWTRMAFGWRTALLAAALLGVGFWPLASSREALRAGMLPLFMTFAVILFWRIVFWSQANAGVKRRPVTVLLFALSIAATFHIYLAARLTWLLFPLFLIYLAFLHRRLFRRSVRPVLVGLLLAALLVAPLFIYLTANPEMQTRLSMLDGPVEQIRSGQLLPLANTSVSALLAFVWPGYGDQFLAYNIPGRPVFDAITGLFFIAGIIVSLLRWRQPAYAFLLLWFTVGILPSLVTGPTAGTTRNLAALPAVYVLPAVGFMAVAGWMRVRNRALTRVAVPVTVALWLLWAGWVTGRDYFFRWGQEPAVRAAYQHTLIEGLTYAAEMTEAPLVVSTVYPGPVHDASIALLLQGRAGLDNTRWVDARRALVLPAGAPARALVPSSTPPHPRYESLLSPLEQVTLRADDLDPSFGVYDLVTPPATPWAVTAPQADFGGAVALLQAEWLSPSVPPGGTAELLTVWRVLDPARVGPNHLPADAPDTVLFTHVLQPNGTLLAQQDALDAPAWSWQTGDLVLQIHTLAVPEGTPAGDYQAVVGVYDRPTGQRLPVLQQNGESGETAWPVMALRVANS